MDAVKIILYDINGDLHATLYIGRDHPLLQAAALDFNGDIYLFQGQTTEPDIISLVYFAQVVYKISAEDRAAVPATKLH